MRTVLGLSVYLGDGGVTFCSFFASELTSERFTSDSSISQQAEGADALTDDDFSAGAAAGAATVSSGDDTEATNPRLGEQELGDSPPKPNKHPQPPQK